MNWKLIAIILLIAVILVGAYSANFLAPEKQDEGTTETSESFELSANIQSDFWDGFSTWLFANLMWILGIGAVLGGGIYYLNSRD